MLLRLPADHLLDDHGLADAGAAEHPDLAALHVRLEEVDHLDACLEHLLLRLELRERRRLPVDRPAVARVDLGGVRVQWFPDHVVDVPQDALAHRDADRCPRVHHRRTSDETVGRLQGDRADDRVADVLGDLARDRGGLGLQRQVHGERRVDLGQLRRWELHVHHRSDHPDHAPLGVLLLARSWHRHPSEPAAIDSAPPTISMISVVISSWRARFAWRVRILMRSSALSVAAFIARRRAAFSEAADSSSAA